MEKISVKYRSLKGRESELGKEHTPLNSKRKKTSSSMKNGQRASKVVLHRKLYKQPVDVLKKKMLRILMTHWGDAS